MQINSLLCNEHDVQNVHWKIRQRLVPLMIPRRYFYKKKMSWALYFFNDYFDTERDKGKLY